MFIRCLTVYRRGLVGLVTVKHVYTLSDRLQAGLSCGSLLLIIGVKFNAIFMSDSIAEETNF